MFHVKQITDVRIILFIPLKLSVPYEIIKLLDKQKGHKLCQTYTQLNLY